MVKRIGPKNYSIFQGLETGTLDPKECYLCHDTGIVSGNGPYAARFCSCEHGDLNRLLMQFAKQLRSLGFKIEEE